MTVEVRLFATLRQYLPPGSERARVRMEMPQGASIADVLARLGVPQDSAKLVLLDGRFEADRTRPLDDGVVLSVFPPIAGG
jgi:molybdopterin converting factor small subunit